MRVHGSPRSRSVAGPRVAVLCLLLFATAVFAADLAGIRKAGMLRHLGIPYANFVTGTGDGMDVDLMRMFAESLGVKYVYVPTDWGTIVQDLSGKKVKVSGSEVTVEGTAPIKGDIIANGYTILPWREKVFLFSTPTFPSQIWLIARAESEVAPIKPTGDILKDIALTKTLMKDRVVMSMEKTCLDPALYNLAATGARVLCYKGNLNELAPAVINGKAEMTILDVPDALVALAKWPGKIKIIGPVSDKQQMGAAFPMDAPDLRDAYNRFLDGAKKSGVYLELVKKYYPSAVFYFPDFFKNQK